MKQLFLKPMLLLSLALLPATTYSQGLQRYTNSLFAEYGLMRYNNDGSEWLGENSRLLSAGLGYYKDLSGFLALGFKAKHYAVRGPSQYAYNSNTIQLQFRVQRPRISRTFRLRRFSPYVEAGFGHATEYSGQKADEYSAVYAFASLAAGADYSFSDHWSLGLQGEYRLSGKDAATVLEDLRQALNPFNTISARLNFYFGRNRNRPAVPRIYTRMGTVVPADSTVLHTRPVSRELQSAVPAVPALPQAGTATVKDTLLVRIVHADAGNNNAHPAGMPEPAPVLLRTDTLATRDTAILPRQNTITGTDTMAGIKQVTAGIGSATTILKQEPVFKKDSNEVIAKMPAPVQGSDTTPPQQSAIRGKIDALLSVDSSIRPKPDTATTSAGSSPVRVKQDTVWRTIRDTITLYKRDTITVFATDTVTKLERDTVVARDGAGQQATGLLYRQQHTQELKSAAEETGRAGTAHLKEQDKQEPANATQRAGQDAFPQQTTAADEQLEQRLEELEAENTELQNRLQESETRSREQAAVNELTAKQATARDPMLPLPLLTPAGGGKSSTNLVVLPVGTGAGKKSSNDKEGPGQEQRRIAQRQDSILQQLSLVQAKLAQLQAPQADTVVATNDSLQYADSSAANDTLVKRSAVKPHTDSVQQALQRQIRQLHKENEALQQMVGTISGPAPTEQSSGKPARPAAHDVFFNVNQSRPDTPALEQLLAFSGTLHSSGAYWILLEGFTDKSGNAAYNLQLSRKRVAAVKAVLVEQGIPKEHILEKTFGSRFSTGLSNSNDRKVRITQILR